ncbi:MAG: hypothetical protein Q8K94_08515, partial [Moraxellaceae bacterium]|nr:hypothetical protein [Moraxellaceae bacterium]
MLMVPNFRQIKVYLRVFLYSKSWFLFLMRLTGYRRLELIAIEEDAKVIKSVCLDGVYSITSPLSNRVASGQSKEVNVYELSDVIVSAYASVFERDGVLLLYNEKIKNKIRLKINGVDEVAGEYYSRASYDKFVDKALFLGGDGAFNWYHF